ncbi:hypothetical protein V6N13_112211 [Hibiscus sabdariffa]
MAVVFYDENLYVFKVKSDTEAKALEAIPSVDILNAVNTSKLPPTSVIKQLATTVELCVMSGCRGSEEFKGIQKEMCLPCSLDFTELMAIRFALKVFVEAGLKEYNQGGIRLCPKGSKLMVIHSSKEGMCREHLFKMVVLASLIMREICSDDFCGWDMVDCVCCYLGDVYGFIDMMFCGHISS